MLKKLASKLRGTQKPRKKKVKLPKDNILPPRDTLPPKITSNAWGRVIEIPRKLWDMLDEDIKRGELSDRTKEYLKELGTKGQEEAFIKLFNSDDMEEYVVNIAYDYWDVGDSLEFLADHLPDMVFDDADGTIFSLEDEVWEYLTKHGAPREMVKDAVDVFRKNKPYVETFKERDMENLIRSKTNLENIFDDVVDELRRKEEDEERWQKRRPRW